MRQRNDDARSFGHSFAKGFRLESILWVPVDNDIFNKDFPPYVEMNPAGAVDILMPNVTMADRGLAFLLSNISASTITLKTAADAAFATAIVLATMENAWVFCTGSTTANLGWRGTATAPST